MCNSHEPYDVVLSFFRWLVVVHNDNNRHLIWMLVPESLVWICISYYWVLYFKFLKFDVCYFAIIFTYCTINRSSRDYFCLPLRTLFYQHCFKLEFMSKPNQMAWGGSRPLAGDAHFLPAPGSGRRYNG